jgi:site-specific DNA-adenine methylase
MKLSPPLKYHGGKQYLANKILSLFPPHVHYVEPSAGGKTKRRMVESVWCNYTV